MAQALSLAAVQAIRLSPEATRRVMVYTCAIALIGAGYFAPSAAASTACLASKAFAASV
ncbi:MAG: hypothetical protein JSR96_07625 [Proteobacteria bacterium]|nr:hypothetical protein [Pseudomonadota bacterium]